MTLRIVANTTYFDPLPQEREPEEMSFEKPYTDKEVRRTNPKRFDERTDWTEMNNEKGHDSDVANRYAAVPTSAILFKIEDACGTPTKQKLADLRRFLYGMSFDARAEVYDYVQEQLTALEYQSSRQRTATTVVPHAIRYYVLSKLFD